MAKGNGVRWRRVLAVWGLIVAVETLQGVLCRGWASCRRGSWGWSAAHC
jgi:hypothetical protein